MKKRKFLAVLLMALTTTVALTSCEKDEDEPTPTNPNTYGQVNFYTAKLLGGQNNVTAGSFYSASEDSVYTSANAATNQAKIDVVYFYGTTNAASLGAPSDATVLEAHTGSTSLPDWTVKNATKFFKTSISALDFLMSANDSLILTVSDSLSTTTLANKLEVGQIVAFKTVTNKMGLIHVQNIGGSTGLDRDITINVKIQK